MKILKIEVNGLPNFENKLEICFMAQQRVSADDKEKLVNVFSNIYVNKVVSFVGINASGKTTILITISFVMKMLNNQSINNIQSRVILNDMGEDDQVVITTFFYDGSNVNKLETYIGKEISEMDGSERFVIRDEILWSKGTSKVE